MFSCEFCEILQKTFLYRTLLVFVSALAKDCSLKAEELFSGTFNLIPRNNVLQHKDGVSRGPACYIVKKVRVR